MKAKKFHLGLAFLAVLLLVISSFANAHSADPLTPAHQYLANESQRLWKTIPSEMKNHLSNDISNELYLPDELCILGSCVSYDGREEGCYDSGDDIITGSAEEDYCKIDGALGGDSPIPALFRNHYWNPDDPDFSQYDTGLYLSEGSFIHGTVLWDKALSLYLKGDINKSYYYLGRVIHLMQDASVPAHMHNDGHWPDRDEYEYFIANVNGSYPDTTNKPNFYHWQGSDYAGEEYKYENLTYLNETQWLEINKRLNELSYQSNLFKLFWYTAQKTQYFASDDNDGNDYYRKWWQITGTNTFSPSLWQTNEANITSDNSLIEDASTCGSLNSCPNLRNISEALMPHAMKATAGLYRLFYDVANSYHWSTFHHDNRRTGFTLLKGDMTKESQVEKINLVLQGDVTSDSIARPSIADIDGNGNMETVITIRRGEIL